MSGRNEKTNINITKNKCALHTTVAKWPILKESIANWVLENHQNGLFITRNSVEQF